MAFWPVDTNNRHGLHSGIHAGLIHNPIPTQDALENTSIMRPIGLLTNQSKYCARNMEKSPRIKWTNKSVKAFADNADPIEAIEKAARALVLKARESGWSGPPFNPLKIADLLDVKIEANSNIGDARLIQTPKGAKIEFNPLQARERLRFSIAHEVAHLLFSDWHEQIRNRETKRGKGDNWQLEMLCNIAASEFVLPIGSLSEISPALPLEKLMIRRREYDVSAEAFLIRLANISAEPIVVFFATPKSTQKTGRTYRVDYFVSSPTAPRIWLYGAEVPADSVIRNCTAIGYTDRSIESWVSGTDTEVECVGIPSYPGSTYPRVAVLVRFNESREDRHPIKFVHGNVLDPRGQGLKILCQVVNDRAAKWGGGVARQAAKKFPDAEVDFSLKIRNVPRSERLGSAVFTEGDEEIIIASLVAQDGYGPSKSPRIRYAALEQSLTVVTARAIDDGASIHMPRIGMGEAGGEWSIISEMIENVMVRAGLPVTIYDLPPKREQFELI